jgi:hypothetical protein
MHLLCRRGLACLPLFLRGHALRDWFLRGVALGTCLALLACSTPPVADIGATALADAIVNPWSAGSQASSKPVQTWQHFALPGKQVTSYNYARVDGRDTMAVKAVSSASLLRQKVRVPPDELHHIKFSWKVPELIAQADLAVRDVADSPVRIVLAFEGDYSKFSGKNAMLSELSRLLTGEPMPYATLMYVWSNKRPAGSVIISPRTDRIRKLVVESGSQNLNQWLDYERNISADFEKAFGEAPGALVGIAIMTDTDNTRSSTQAWYGPVTLAGR